MSVEKKKWIEFREVEPEKPRKTKIWQVFTNDPDGALYLGSIEWFGAWRGYAFSPPINRFTYFEKTRLRDIADFIEEKNKARRLERNAEKVTA